MQPIASDIEKTYPPRGPLQQYRFKEATAFHCFRCGTSKKAKLISVYGFNWDHRLCNGCYGRLLSIYNVKAGTGQQDLKVEELARQLLETLNQDGFDRAEQLFLLSERRAEILHPNAIRFLATAEHVSKSLSIDSSLEWSPAVIGLCKAVELEVIERLVTPLRNSLQPIMLAEDIKDKDIGRIAHYCAGYPKSPELGSFAHFLQTIIYSENRRSSSVLIREFLTRLRNLPNANWLLDPKGFHSSITELTSKYRNRAAHIDELTRLNYEECKKLVIGNDGMLWRLVRATQPHHS